MKWICLILGFILSILSADMILPGAHSYNINVNQYQGRESIKAFMRDVFTKKNFTQMLVDDVVIQAYDYQNQRPMFFSKYF